ncbi:MAG TPA: tetratricopeptide repeat protein, partial [Polyangiaceae bacterium]|nr:tetratricopeptide repeat protein [Polyangiaceae bacterium]
MRRFLSVAGALAIVFTATQVLSQGAPPKAPPPAPAKAAAPPAAPPKAPPPAAPKAAPAQPKAAPAPRPAAPVEGAAAVPQHCSPSGMARGTTGAALPRGKAKEAAKPTKQQLRALAALQKEAEAYEKDAKDYRAAITRIVRHHYEDKKRRILSSLNREITIEQQGLKTARDQAIKELEDFVAKYSGENAHQKNTPDAMFRLAALYEEKEREVQENVQVAPGETLPPPDLKKAIALYKRIVVEFPKYDEVAAVFYHLGHAYQDMGRLEESQQVWRSLVCHNHFEYPVPPDPSDPEKDSIARLPQDHESEWWLGWMSRHGTPITTRAPKGTAPKAPGPRGANVVGDEESFRDPYPDDCQAVQQVVQEGEEPRYVAEVWWRLGDYHFDEIDPWGGAFNLNRAERAYRQAMKIGKPPLYGVAMYKLAWTFYKQQRYEDAVKQFVELLHYTDKRQKETGNPGTDFRTEAYAYIAGSLTYVDFEGPGPDDPY